MILAYILYIACCALSVAFPYSTTVLLAILVVSFGKKIKKIDKSFALEDERTLK